MKRTLPAAWRCRLQQHLKRGGIIAYPTESCYGLGCLPTHSRALKRLMQLKKRPQHKGLIVIADSLSRLQPLLADLSPEQQNLLQQTWPAAKTFVVPCADKVLPALRGKGRDKLATRVPNHTLARQLCHDLRTPLVSTSCNRASRRPCKSEREVRRQFGRHVWIVRGNIGNSKTPSQIIDLESGKRLR
ncbi:MAG: L-threonylcarbamoyladenylate synthase [Neisseria sp.]|nr:L-threonylcarbamoyladenylate synthase [Neisseria sp.]